jgi:TonB-dependent SusC/RagA subfamily outer membrane receptor
MFFVLKISPGKIGKPEGFQLPFRTFVLVVIFVKYFFMKSIPIILLAFACLAIASCSSTQNASTSSKDFSRKSDIENPDHSISLVDHLRRVSGVQVSGNGNNAKITIRGINSFYGSSEPLFVVNGQPLGGGLADAIQVVPVESIQSIRVLKNATDIGFYGVRGANGVIVIDLKKSND